MLSSCSKAQRDIIYIDDENLGYTVSDIRELYIAGEDNVLDLSFNKFDFGKKIYISRDILKEKDILSLFSWHINNKGYALSQIYSDGFLNEEYLELVKTNKDIDLHIEEFKSFYSETEDKRGVITALIDTGVDINSDNFVNAFFYNNAEVADDGVDNDGNTYIDDVCGYNIRDKKPYFDIGGKEKHATLNAGIMSAGKYIDGICDTNFIKILPLKAMDTDGNAYSDDIKEAIIYAYNMGAKICNLSLSSQDYDEDLYKLISGLDMLFIISAGNGDKSFKGMNVDENKVYPGCYEADNIINVANLGYDGLIAPGSNYGKENVDILAPGSGILSASTGNGFDIDSGTSMSAPIISAIAAMIYSGRTDMSLSDVKTAICNTVTKKDIYKDKIKYGGYVNAYDAIRYEK